MSKKTVPLDQLEVMMQLVKIKNPELKSATYNEISKAVSKEFNVKCDEDDIFLLHEPQIDELEREAEIYYSNMLNYSPFKTIENA